MSAQTLLVETFYHDVWNKNDAAKAKEILSPDFRFRGSLGPEKTGPDGFAAYMQSVHSALGEYRCLIKELIVSDNKAAARMLFRGIHRGPFFGVEATGKTIEWAGAAFFEFQDEKISQLWVLGDIDSVKAQLGLVSLTGQMSPPPV